MDVSIFGLGYVGTVCLGCLAKDGHNVVGVDVVAAKVESMATGVAPIVEPKLPEMIAEAHRAGRISATTSAARAIHGTDISLVCVGTPSESNGSLNLAYVKRACQEIGEAQRHKSGRHVVVFRSTMLPGTTEDVLIPILESSSGKKAGAGFEVCYNPEFLREGSSVDDFYGPPKIVVGEATPGSGDRLMQLYEGIDAPRIRTSIRVAEMVKYCDNAYHALKATFANEVGYLCRGLGVDSHEVMAIFCQDRKLNISDAYLKPGFAFGGSCLPKDLRALTYQAKHLDVRTPVLNAIMHSNEVQTQVGIQRIIDKASKKVGFLGIAFKHDTDDLRESPVVTLVETLIGKGYQVKVYDRNISMSRLIGANKRFMEVHIPHLAALLVDDINDVAAASDVLVVGYKSPEFIEVLKTLRPDQTVIDLVRLEREVATPAKYEGICW